MSNLKWMGHSTSHDLLCMHYIVCLVPEMICDTTPLSRQGMITITWQFIHTGGLDLTGISMQLWSQPVRPTVWFSWWCSNTRAGSDDREWSNDIQLCSTKCCCRKPLHLQNHFFKWNGRLQHRLSSSISWLRWVCNTILCLTTIVQLCGNGFWIP